MIDPAKVYTINEAAELLGVKAVAIRWRVNSRTLPATRFGRQWAITGQALLDWKPLKRGRARAKPACRRCGGSGNEPVPSPPETNGAT